MATTRFYTDDVINGVPQLAGQSPDRVQQLIDGAQLLYEYVQAHEGISIEDLQAWVKSIGATNDDLVACIQLLQSWGHLYQLQGVPVLPQADTPAAASEPPAPG
jgi:hypothetical protein